MPEKGVPSLFLKPESLPVLPLVTRVSTCFGVSFLPSISWGIRKSHDFPYSVQPHAVFPLTTLPFPHLGHVREVGAAGVLGARFSFLVS